METPAVRYITTSDGVRIAMEVSGKGPTLIHTPNGPLCNLHLERQLPARARWFEALASRFRLVRFDQRGSGLSEREVEDVTAAGLLRDLQAVVTNVEAEEFTVFGFLRGYETTLGLAVSPPKGLLAAIIWIPDLGQAEATQRRALTRMLKDDWNAYTELYTQVAMDWADGDEAHRLAAVMRESVSRETWLKVRRERIREDIDWLAVASRVKVPALVLQREMRQSPDLAGRFAAALPLGQHVILDGGETLPYLGNIEYAADVMLQFVQARGADNGSDASHGIRTILFTDLVGHTEMMSRLGDASGRELLREHERITRLCLNDHGGKEVKSLGDGFMAWFASAQDALDCAVALQRSLSNAANGTGRPLGLHVRCGLNAGEPIAEDNDLFGASVIIASRIADKATAGQILVANVVRELLVGKGYIFAPQGDHQLKGITELVRIWELRWDT